MQVSNAAASHASQVNSVQNKSVKKTEDTAEKKQTAPAADSVSISDAARNMLAASSQSSKA